MSTSHEHQRAADTRVSVVIPTFNGVEYTRACIESLVAAGWDDRDELVIVDNASTDGTRELLESLDGSVRVVLNDVNRNFAGACNQGVEVARGEWIVLLNNDTEVTPGWLDAMVAAADQNGADVVGSRLLYTDGRIQHAGICCERGVFPRHVLRYEPGDNELASRSYEVQAVTGACMLVRRRLYLDLGGLDEGFRNGCEDLDFCFGARARGAKVWYCGASVVMHHESVSIGRNDHDEDNSIRLFDRWGDLIRSDRVSGDRIIEVAAEGLPWRRRPLVRTSIVIPLFNRLEMTKACIASIHEAGLPDDAEIILVDNASTDGTREWCDEICGEIRVIRNEMNTNFSGACNRGMSHALGQNIIFLNNDTEVTPGWVEALVDKLEDPRVGVVGSRLLYPDGTIQHAGVAFGEDRIGFHINAGAPAEDPAVMVPRAMQAVTGACMAVDREAFLQTTLDLSYRNGCEDVDLCMRIAQLGLTVWYEPSSVVVHHESQSAGRFDHAPANIELFLRRWRDVIIPDVDTFDRAATIADGVFQYPAQAGPWTRRHALDLSAVGAGTDTVILHDAVPDEAAALLQMMEADPDGRQREWVLIGRPDHRQGLQRVAVDAAARGIGDVHVLDGDVPTTSQQLNDALRSSAGEWIVVAQARPAAATGITSALDRRTDADPLQPAGMQLGLFVGVEQDDPVLAMSRSLVDRVGGFHRGLTAAGTRARDLIGRSALHGVVAATLSTAPESSWDHIAQWGAPQGVEHRVWDDLWNRSSARTTPRLVRLHEPLIAPGATREDVDFSTRSLVLLVTYEPGYDQEFRASIDAVCSNVDGGDDISVIVRAGHHLDAVGQLLDERCAHVADAELPDLVLVESGPEHDAALCELADIVMCHGLSGVAIHAIALQNECLPVDPSQLSRHVMKRDERSAA